MPKHHEHEIEAPSKLWAWLRTHTMPNWRRILWRDVAVASNMSHGTLYAIAKGQEPTAEQKDAILAGLPSMGLDVKEKDLW